jgi:hypothetical protein
MKKSCHWFYLFGPFRSLVHRSGRRKKEGEPQEPDYYVEVEERPWIQS